MGEKIAEVLGFINNGKIGTVKKEDLERSFDGYIIKETIAQGYVQTEGSGNEETCKLTNLGYSFLNDARMRQALEDERSLQVRINREQAKSSRKANIIAVLSLAVAIIAIIVSVSHH